MRHILAAAHREYDVPHLNDDGVMNVFAHALPAPRRTVPSADGSNDYVLI